MIKNYFLQHKTAITIAASVILIITSIAAVGSYVFAKTYADRIYPNVYISDISVGGLTPEEAQEKLEQAIQNMIDSGLWISVDDEQAHFSLQINSENPDLARDLIYINPATETDRAFNYGRGANLWENAMQILSLIGQKQKLTPDITINEEAIRKAVLKKFSDKETKALPTDYRISFSENDINIEVKPGKTGYALDFETAFNELKNDSLDFKLNTLAINLITTESDINEEEALTLSDDIKTAIQAAPYTLTYTAQNTDQYSWTVDKYKLADWLIPAKNDDGQIILSLGGKAYENFVNTIHNTIDTDPINAKFKMENDKVVEFQGSVDGITFNEEKTKEDLLAALGTKEATIEISVQQTPPEITTESVNNLGIKEIIGVGTSNFSGSPANRIANIKHGAAKLNGLLIAPDETVSLIEQLGPFTQADGYLPELVIKGDEIKAEIGGGLCQIGTTTFRAVMNAGLEVVERRNHSLVVSYYNDPSNGNPGTDATIYDPAPDFKFKNDTGNYILLTTDVDVDSGQLTFTFWGTSDGRKGYYTPPQVLSWQSYGPTQYTQTTDLAPGQYKCQAAHPGATATFDYIVEYADGETFKKTFTSVYRSLPQICLVGVAELTPECAENGECTNTTGNFSTEEENAEETENQTDNETNVSDANNETKGNTDDDTKEATESET